MMVNYAAVEGRFPAIDEDALAAVLGSFPVLGCSVEDSTAGLTRVVVYLAPGCEGFIGELVAALVGVGAEATTVSSIKERDWLRRYREVCRPFTVGSGWWMDPHPEAPTAAPPGRRRLVIEPRSAFGTGSHESTRLLLLELERLPLAGRTVLDVGTGTGVLALAAETLAAETVVGFDVDVHSVFIARQTRALQELESRVFYFAGTFPAIGEVTFDVVLCNMLWEHAGPLIPDLARCIAPGGVGLLSGFLVSQQPEVEAACSRHGLGAGRRGRLGEWMSLRVHHG